MSKSAKLFKAFLSIMKDAPQTRRDRIEFWERMILGLGCKIVGAVEMADLVNEGPGEYFCMPSIRISTVKDNWVLVPKELAMKTLVLGELPPLTIPQKQL